MKAAHEGAMARAGQRLRRLGGWIRRHPAKTVGLFPLAVLLYVLALYPFTPSIGDIRKSKQESPSVVLSADGKELASFKRANRDWVKLSDISPRVTQALLATEDKRFYDHHGIDVVRTAKALVNTLTGDVEGGSTITQQLARNLYPEQIGREQTITRKVKEAITALKIEAIYSKDEILESYLNSVSFLYNAWGIEMASRTYFDKPAKNLNELEAATLVGMLKGTAYYNPVMNPERALHRRNTVLAMMVKEGKLPEQRYEQLKGQPLKLDFERLQEVNGPAPHLTEYLRRWLTEWADKNNYDIYSDGLVVKTTIDSRLQDMANQAVQRQMKQLQAVADVEWSRSGVPGLGSDPAAYLAQRGSVKPFDYFWNTNQKLVKDWIRESAEYKAQRDLRKSDAEALETLEHDSAYMLALRKQKTMLQTGFLAIDPSSGAVRAWVGSRDYNEDKFDHVQQARRQPGSTFKPFVYGAAFESGMRPTDTFLDGPVEIRIDRNQVWRPTDIDGMTNAPMTLRDGLAKSKNTITAQVMQQVGPARVASLARAMGVRQSKLQEVPSLALGTSPVTLKEMVTAFGTIANGGKYIEPQIVTAVEDRQHRVLQDFHNGLGETALSNEAAMTLLDVMRGVIDSGTAAGLRPRFGLTGDLAGKTGTTQDNTDGWFILMHPQLVAGAWVGFNDNRVAMRSSYWGQGAHNALLVVGDFAQQAQKAKVIAADANFAAPRLKDEEKPLMDRMGDWWNNVFNTAPPTPGTDSTTTAATPEVRLDPPVLMPAPSGSQPSIAVQPTTGGPVAVPSVPYNAPAADQPQRVPAFPRPLETTRTPVDSIPGTQVFRAPDPAAPADVVRAPQPSITRTPSTSSANAPATPVTPPVNSMGASGTGRVEPAAPRSTTSPSTASPGGSEPPLKVLEPTPREWPSAPTGSSGGGAAPIGEATGSAGSTQ